MAASSPTNTSLCMSQQGPSDSRFQIPGGALLYHPQRDARFPYLYRISSHALVPSNVRFNTILIRIVDTSMDARTRSAQFNETLSVPLGPDAQMDNYGT
jgi:hypothetical protein